MSRWLESVCNLLFFLMKLSAIYLVLVLCGGVVLGFSPANASLLSLYDQHRMDASKYHFRDGWSLFKANFVQLNLAVGLFLSLLLVLFTGLWLAIQLPPSWWSLLAILANSCGLFYLFSLYGLFLKLQVHFEFSLFLGIKLAAISLFLNWKSPLRFLLGSLVVAFFWAEVPLILSFFLPAIWLIFVYDIFDPIYQQVDRDFL